MRLASLETLTCADPLVLAFGLAHFRWLGSPHDPPCRQHPLVYRFLEKRVKSPSLVQKSRSLVPLACFGLFFAMSPAGATALPVVSTPFPSAFSAASLGAPVSLGDLEVQWKGKTYSLDEIGAAFSEGQGLGVLARLRTYSDWVTSNEYVVALSSDARVILVTPDKRQSKRSLKLVEETLSAFDELMSPPVRSRAQEAAAEVADSAEEDDPFADAFGPVSTGEEADHVPDSGPVLLFEVGEENQYRELLTGVGNDNPRMEGWARSVASEPGFAEEQISAAAWQSAPDGYELGDVWRPQNELVNRLARLLIHRSFGAQPTWLRVSAAWRVEMQVHGDIYCFPYRKEFVGIGDHGGWEPNIKTQFKKRKKKPLQPDEFASWQRNTWDENKAHLSWGVMEYLARFKPEALPAIAEQFRLMFNDGYKTTYPDGTWTTDPRFEIPLEEQAAVLQSHLGDAYLEDISEFFAKGRSYRPKKKKR